MELSIIVAIAENGVIGGGNELLWHIPEDLKRFKRITSGRSVVMGRKTFESIGKPLPNRRNIVITRNPEFRVEGIEVANSLNAALELTKTEDEVFIIGGGEIYRQALPLATKLYITRVHANYDGDTYFPEIPMQQWQLVSSEKGNPTARPGYTFEEYTRIKF
ncbi:MAG: dihydrofolate reductase [Bacteroidota bacterium]